MLYLIDFIRIETQVTLAFRYMAAKRSMVSRFPSKTPIDDVTLLRDVNGLLFGTFSLRASAFTSERAKPSLLLALNFSKQSACQ